MDDLYRRPDRAEIAARVEAQLAAERSGAFTGGPGWDPLGAAELDEDRACKRCGDRVAYLGSDDLCDGCVAEDAATVTPPPAARCEACGYLTTAPGHLIACGPS